MKRKVKSVVLRNIIDCKRRISDFEEWLNDTIAMQQLREMDAKNVVSIMREVWEEIKSKN